MPDGLGTIGKQLIFFGLLVIGIGVVLVLIGKFPGLRIGRLPGDIYIEREGFRFYFPLATSIIVSIIVSLVLWFIGSRSSR
jgi:hypothetical protein